MSPIISPRELAAAIGVSESSLKRWADDGLIHVSRTAGGHRRITIGEAIRFIRAIRAPLVRPHLLGLTDLSAGGDLVFSADAPGEQFFKLLRDGESRAARALLLSLYLAGQSVVEIADGPIREAMQRMGEAWEHDPAWIFIEHRATDICIQAVQQLRQFVEPPRDGPVALGGAPAGDPYLLPSMLAATALTAAGFQTINLGPDTPFEALGTAVERHQPCVVWLSVSAIADEHALRTGLIDFAERLAERAVTLVIGGRVLSTFAVPTAKALRCGASLAELVAIACEVREAGLVGPAGGSVSPENAMLAADGKSGDAA